MADETTAPEGKETTATAATPVVTVVDPHGRRFDVPANEIEAALRDPIARLHIESPQEKAEREYRDKFETPGQQVKTAIEGFLHGATLGISTPIEVGLGVPKESILGRKTINPTLYGVSQVPGAIATAAATAGLGTAAEAGAAAELAAGATGAGESLLAQTAAAAGREALVGTAWGAASGLGDVIHEKALGNPNLSAQQILDHVGLSAALGGTLGGVLGATGALVPAALKRSRDVLSNVYNRGKGPAAEALGTKEVISGTQRSLEELLAANPAAVEALDQRIPGLSAELKNATPGMADWALKNHEKIAAYEAAFPGAAKNLIRSDAQTADLLVNNFGRIVKDPRAEAAVAKEMAKGVGDVYTTIDKLLAKANREYVPAEEEALLRPLQASRGAAAQEAYSGLYDKIGAVQTAMLTEPERFETAHPKFLEDVGKGLIRDSSEDIVVTFRRIRELKKQLDDEITVIPLRQISNSKERNSQRYLRQLRGEVNATLKDPVVWGEAAARRAALDEVTHEFLRFTGKNSPFRRLFLQKVESGLLQGSDKKARTFIRAMMSQNEPEGAEILGQFMSLANKALEEAEKSATHVPAGAFDKQAVTEVIAKSAKQSADLAEKARIAAAHERVMGMPEPVKPVIPVAPVVEPTLTSLLLRKAFGLATDVAIAKTGMLGVGLKMAAKTVGAVARGTRVLGEIQRINSEAAKRIGKLAAAVASGSRTAFKVGTRAAEMLSAEEVRELSGNPDLMASKLEEVGAHGLYEHAPDTVSALGIHLSRSVSYLNSVLPEVKKTGPLGPELEPSPGEMAKYNRVAPIVNEPTLILSHLGRGTLTADMVEAAQMTAPEILEAMRMQVLMELTEHQDAQVSYPTRMGLSLLYGQPMDASTTPQGITANQLPYQQQRQAQQAAKTPPGGIKPLKPLSSAGAMRGAQRIHQSSRMPTNSQMSTIRLRGDQ